MMIGRNLTTHPWRTTDGKRFGRCVSPRSEPNQFLSHHNTERIFMLQEKSVKGRSSRGVAGGLCVRSAMQPFFPVPPVATGGLEGLSSIGSPPRESPAGGQET